MLKIKFKKFLTGTVLLMIVLSTAVAVLFYPKPARADIIDILSGWVPDWIKTAISKAWTAGGAVAYKNALNYFLGQVARQSAEYIASGGKGQQPMFVNSEKFWTNMGDKIKGEFLDEIAYGFTGRSLCDPIDPTIRLKMMTLYLPKYKESKFEDKLDCPLSVIKSRLKEARKKKLFEFVAETKEGPVKKLKVDMKILLAQDVVLNKSAGPWVCHNDGYYNLVKDTKGDLCCQKRGWTDCEPAGDAGPAVNAGAGYLLDKINELAEVQDEYEEIIVAWGEAQSSKEEQGKLKEKIDEINQEVADLESRIASCKKKRTCQDLNEKKKKLENKRERIMENYESYSSDIRIAAGTVKLALERLENKIRDNVWGVMGVNEKGEWDKTKLRAASDEEIPLWWWQAYVSKCAVEKEADFCGAPECRRIFQLARGEDKDCQGKEYANALAYTKRFNEYVKQTIDWANTLGKMIKETKPSEEEIALPEISPLEDLSRMYTPGGSDVEVQMELQSQLFDRQVRKVEESKFFQILQGRLSDKKSLVSGISLTPSIYIDETTREAVKGTSASIKQYTGVALADALGVFTNTLTNKFMEKVITGFFNPAASPKGKDSSALSPDEPYRPSKQESKTMFADLTTFSLKKGGEISIYDEFAVFPTNSLYALPMNCLLNQGGLLDAVEQGLTIQEALDKGFLPDVVVGQPGAQGSCSSQPTDLLSYPNVKKLRRARILPLGLEIAAYQNYKGLITPPYTLGQIVNDFNKTNSLGDCSIWNGNFEIDNDKNDFPDGWDKRQGGKDPVSGKCESEIKVISNDRKFGLLAVQIFQKANSDNKNNEWVALKKDLKNVFKAGTEITLSFWYKGKIDRRADQTICYQIGWCSQSSAGGQPPFNQLGQKSPYPGLGFDSIPAGDYGNWTQYKSTRTIPAAMTTDCYNSDNRQGYCLKELGIGNLGYGNVPTDNKLLIDGVQLTIGSTAPAEYIWQEASPFCHLVNPNWVLKSSSYQCEARGYSAVPEADSAQRQETCVDLKDCIHESEDGSCDTWAYCTREKNIWRMSGDQCAEQYATCQTYVRSKDKKQFSYLARTLDFGDCDSTSVGCQWYCLEWKDGSEGTWNCLDGPGMGKSIFFNSQAEKCSASAEGCNEYIRIAAGQELEYQGGGYGGYYGYSNYQAGDNKVYLKNPESCQEKDVGCQFYFPADRDDPVVSGVVKPENVCPAECLGYETFNQAPTYFDNNPDWISFIPETGQSCSAPGCEEFTNLDEIARGGEGLEYYAYLRQCVKVDAQNQAVVDSDSKPIEPPRTDICQNYFTWIGSENTGYQLKKYTLKAQTDGGPAEVMDYEDAKGFWNECRDKNDALNNPHCKEFYDKEGKIYYRLYKNTLICSQDCHPYRQTSTGEVKMSVLTEGESCGKKDVGCREYKGPAAGNIRRAFWNNFENGSLAPWEAGESGIDLVYSAESVNFPGHSMAVQNKAFLDTASVKTNVVDSVSQGKMYFLSFWAKTRTANSSVLESRFKGTGGNDLSFGRKPINLDWNEYIFGPLIFSRPISSDEELWIIGEGEDYYLDNIVLKEVQDNIYLIKDSWLTPLVCNQDLSGQDSFGFMIGCRAYTDRQGENLSLKSFAHLCPEKAVGCEAMIKTQNSAYPFEQTFNSKDRMSRIIVPADELVYLVNNPEIYCQSIDKGCQKMGLPKLNQEGAVMGWSDLYLRNNPDLYDSKPTLCQSNDLGCQAYENGIYFKDPEPQGKVCQYNENNPGWFKADTGEPCSYLGAEPYQVKGIPGIKSFGEVGYKGWAGVCPFDQTGCTGFVDFNWDESGYKKCVSGKQRGEDCITNADCETYTCSVGGTPCNPQTGCATSKCVGGLVPGSDCTNKPAPADKWCQRCTNNEGLVCGYDAGNPCEFVYCQINGQIDEDVDCGEVGDTCFASQGTCETTPTPEGGCDRDPGGIPCPNVQVYCYGGEKPPGHCCVKGDTAERCFSEEDCCCGTSTGYCYQPDFCQLAQGVCVSDNGACDRSGTCVSNNAVCQSDGALCLAAAPVLSQQSYYYLNNEKLDTCPEFSLKQGCVLLLDPDGPKPKINSFATYKKAAGTDGDSVAPVDCTKRFEDCGGENAKLDYCLYCQPFRQTTNDANVILKVKRDRICAEWLNCVDSYLSWDKASGSYRQICTGIGRCNELVRAGQDFQCKNYINTKPEILTEEVYKNRDVSFYGLDYSGYSLYNQYPVDLLLPSKVEGSDVYKLAYDNTTAAKDIEGDEIEQTCRIYPERDSPFPPETDYSNVNLCEKNNGCQCSYDKVEDNGTTKYYDIGKSSESGTVKTFIGLTGYCLEPDPTKKNACITWWPGMGAGGATGGLKPESSAGYWPADNRQWYCLGEIGEGPHWTDVVGNHCDDSVDGCEESIYKITGLPEIKMREVAKIKVRIGADDAAGQCAWEHLDSRGYHEIGPDSETPWMANEEDDSAGNNDYDCDCDSGGTCLKIRVCFGKDEDCKNNDPEAILDRFEVKRIDKSAGDGSARFDEADIYLINGCQSMVKVAADNDGGKQGIGLAEGVYTDRLWERSNYQLLLSDSSNISRSDICVPYGASGVEKDSLKRLVKIDKNAEDCLLNTTKIVHSTEDLKQLFAKVRDQREFRFRESMLYDDAGEGWDLTTTLPQDHICPIVASVGDSFEVGKVTIVGQDEGGGISKKAGEPITLEFYAWADKDQMPIREIIIDWGDAKPVPQNIIAKNRKPECGGADFGNSPDACVEGSWEFTHVYNCQAGDKTWSNGSCYFQPKVYIKDNWGWCNGGKYAGEKSCLEIDGAGTAYSGQVIVESSSQ